MYNKFLKTFAIAAAALQVCVDMSARQNQDTVCDRYSVTVLGVYDHSRTFANQGGFDVAGHMSWSNCIEADAGFECLGPEILSGTFVARPKLPLRDGELFLDAAVHMRCFNSLGAGTFALAASLGYRTDYVSVQIGAQRTEIMDLRERAGNTGVVEPFNPILRIAFNVRPATSLWNISLGVGNFTLYQYERLYYPILFLCAHYNFASHVGVCAEVDFKPSGVFNYNAHFNGLSARAGITYSF